MNANDVSDRGLDVLSTNLTNLRALGVAGADITDRALERLVEGVRARSSEKKKGSGP